jgi:hypothetical protein
MALLDADWLSEGPIRLNKTLSLSDLERPVGLLGSQPCPTRHGAHGRRQGCQTDHVG